MPGASDSQGRDPVGTTAVLVEDMLLAFDRQVVAEKDVEHPQFGIAQPHTDQRRGTDGAVILDEREAAIGMLGHFGHIAIRRPQTCQCPHAYP